MEIRFKRPWYMRAISYLNENLGPILATVGLISAMIAVSVLIVKCCNDDIDKEDKRNTSATYVFEYVESEHFKTKKMVFKGPEKDVYADTTYLEFGTVDFYGKVSTYLDSSMQWHKLASVEGVHKIKKFYGFRNQTAKKQGKESETKAAHRHNKE